MIRNLFSKIGYLLLGRESEVCIFEREILIGISNRISTQSAALLNNQINSFNFVDHLNGNKSTLFYCRSMGKNCMAVENLFRNREDENFLLSKLKVRNKSEKYLSASIWVTLGQVFEIEYQESVLDFFGVSSFGEIAEFSIQFDSVNDPDG